MYKIYIGDPYEIFSNNDVICTTTNGEVNINNRAVMGKGNALFVKETFKANNIDTLLGIYLKKYGNRAFNLGNYNYNNKNLFLATFPTKNLWRDNSDIKLIKQSAIQIKEIANKFNFKTIYIPIPGCSNGRLKWSDVKIELDILDERFIIYSTNQNDFQE